MRVMIRPMMNPTNEIDVTERLISAIAEELWRIHGGNRQLNWIEAERHLMTIVDEARGATRETQRACAVAAGGGDVVGVPAGIS